MQLYIIIIMTRKYKAFELRDLITYSLYYIYIYMIFYIIFYIIFLYIFVILLINFYFILFFKQNLTTFFYIILIQKHKCKNYNQLNINEIV
jgi:hypothetical protein